MYLRAEVLISVRANSLCRDQEVSRVGSRHMGPAVRSAADRRESRGSTTALAQPDPGYCWYSAIAWITVDLRRGEHVWYTEYGEYLP